MYYVYRYIDLRDDIVKYIGITKRKLKLRIKEHEKQDEWAYHSQCWGIDYFIVRNQSEAEAWESHLISYYKTHKWYNTGKSHWGKIQSFEEIPIKWSSFMIEGIIIDIDYDNYRTIDITDGLVSETTIKLECDIDDLYLRKLIGREIIIPVAKDKNNILWFCEYDRRRVVKLVGLEM